MKGLGTTGCSITESATLLTRRLNDALVVLIPTLFKVSNFGVDDDKYNN